MRQVDEHRVHGELEDDFHHFAVTVEHDKTTVTDVSAQGIRHPSVPRGTARLRITPMASHRDDEIDALSDAIAEELSA